MSKEHNENRLKQFTLDQFAGFSAKVDKSPHSARHCRRTARRVRECEWYVINRLSGGTVGSTELWLELDQYRNVREAVLAKLKLDKVIRTAWGLTPYGMKKVYYLNKQVNKDRNL